MERILLVEPNYKNKYPPIGLMKISSYYKRKGDFVEFHKGILPKNEVVQYDKVLITTLFTFDFETCIDTIRYYIAIVGTKNVYVGGIASTIMPEKFEEAIPGIQILKGQLTSSHVLGYNDNVNVDLLPLDYDILWDIPYEYPAADSYFIYTSRGCPRKCTFCAVKTLEPVFYECENIREQVLRVDEKFGPKKQLLIMDNNALHSTGLGQTVDELVTLGFGSKNNSIKKNNNMRYYIMSLKSRLAINKQHVHLLNRIKSEFTEIKMSRISNEDKIKIKAILGLINNGDDEQFVKYIIDDENDIVSFFERYHYHTVKRYVDFNQGLDARLFTEDKARLLAKLAIKPCRIAFDDIKTKDSYFEALQLASQNGIAHFSNYLLYNYKEYPTDLWNRLYLNVCFCENNDSVKSLFSFPMKYASIEHTDRDYVGQHWNKKYLKSINVILNVTSGVVAKEKDFFVRAFGNTESEYLEILAMPSDFIRYRDYFEKNGLINKWISEYRKLSVEDISRLLRILSDADSEKEVAKLMHGGDLSKILSFYTITKKQVESNKEYYKRNFGAIFE